MRVSGVPYEVDEPSEYTMEFEFIYKAQNYNDSELKSNVTHKKLVFSDAASWDEVLEQFISFLGNCYGYDIKEEIEYTTAEDRVQRAIDKLREPKDE
jgi:hypothetical protein